MDVDHLDLRLGQTVLRGLRNEVCHHQGDRTEAQGAPTELMAELN